MDFKQRYGPQHHTHGRSLTNSKLLHKQQPTILLLFSCSLCCVTRVRFTRKNVPREWSDECQKRFNEVKLKLSSAPVLGFYDPNEKLSSAPVLGFCKLTEAKTAYMPYCCKNVHPISMPHLLLHLLNVTGLKLKRSYCP